jgi:hypothetical protein
MLNGFNRDVVRFGFRYGDGNEEQYCCCWSDDYQRFGAKVAIDPQIIKGISDIPGEALDDFKFNLQLANQKIELEEFLRVISSAAEVRQVPGGEIKLS